MVETTSHPPPVPEDLAFQHRVWLAERIGWVILTVVVLAGLLGVFSGGLASRTTATSAGGALQVDYERFARKTARTHLTIRVARALAPETVVRLSPSLLDAYVIESLYPSPLRSSAGARGLDLVFAPAAAGDLAVHVAARAERFGLIPIAIEVEGIGRVEFKQLIYP